MPTNSSAISDNDFTNPQSRRVATPPRKPRSKEFWEAEPTDPEVQGWKDDPNDPTGPQVGSVANQSSKSPIASAPTPPRPFKQDDAKVTITPDSVTATKTNAKWTEYTKFVDAVTSDESKVASQFIARTAQLQAEGCKIERLLTAAVGISAEGGEFLEIVKKIAFQGKPYDAASINHLRVELGDVLWYVAQACIALDVSLDEIIGQNIDKLSARYPDGHFDSYFSEHRRIDDL
tara:strand:+ start:4561 stop:5259 length:699 start_codon:yes stop_codon:yes gene_type:complete